MFVIRPVDDKTIQEQLCQACQCAYLPEDFAYFAADLSEDGTKLLGILGICQFAIRGECGVVHHLTPFPGTMDEEVMTIMVRTAMEFVHRCGCGEMVLAQDACDADFARRIGFRRKEDGVYAIDLEAFYKSPCHFQAQLKKEENKK